MIRDTVTNKVLDYRDLAYLPSDNGIYDIEVYFLVNNNKNISVSIEAKLDSDNFKIPPEIELKALYRFKEIMSELRSSQKSGGTSEKLLDNMIVSKAKEYIDSKSSERGLDKKKYYQKLVDSKAERDRNLKKVLQLQDLNIVSDEIANLKAKEIIEAIYIFQVRFLARDKSISIDGTLNQDTKNALVISILNQDKIAIIDKSDLEHKNLDEYKKPIIQRIQRYFANIVMQRCNENWEMFGDQTKKVYGDKPSEYWLFWV